MSTGVFSGNESGGDGAGVTGFRVTPQLGFSARTASRLDTWLKEAAVSRRAAKASCACTSPLTSAHSFSGDESKKRAPAATFLQASSAREVQRLVGWPRSSQSSTNEAFTSELVAAAQGHDSCSTQRQSQCIELVGMGGSEATSSPETSLLRYVFACRRHESSLSHSEATTTTPQRPNMDSRIGFMMVAFKHGKVRANARACVW